MFTNSLVGHGFSRAKALLFKRFASLKVCPTQKIRLLSQQGRGEKYIVYSPKIDRGWEAAPTTIFVGGISQSRRKGFEPQISLIITRLLIPQPTYVFYFKKRKIC